MINLAEELFQILFLITNLKNHFWKAEMRIFPNMMRFVERSKIIF